MTNTRPETAHRHDGGRPPLATARGLTNHVDSDRLRRASIDRATDDADASRCGSCFGDAGGV